MSSAFITSRTSLQSVLYLRVQNGFSVPSCVRITVINSYLFLLGIFTTGKKQE